MPRADPSPKFQLNVYGVVPPVTVAVNVTGLPTVGLALTVKLAARGSGATLTVWDEVPVAVLMSVIVTVTVFAPLAA